MHRTRTDELTFSNIQNSLEFVPKSGADRDLLFRTEDGDAPTAFKVQLVPESSPETSPPSTMASRVPLAPDQHVPHVVRMRILGLTGISVDESQPDRPGSPPNPPPKYMKSVVAVTRHFMLHGTSPLSKRLVRAPDQQNRKSNDGSTQQQRYIAIWDSCNDQASNTNSLAFEANLPPETPYGESGDIPRRSMPHRNYELIVGLTTSKKQKPTPVGAVGLPLEEATRLRSKNGKIVLDLPVVNFARLSSDPFAAKAREDLPPKRQLSLRRTFSGASYSLPPAHPSKMERAEYDQQQTSIDLGHNCFMDPAKDAAVLRIELDIQKKVPAQGTKPRSKQESVVLLQPKSDAIELAHTVAKTTKTDSVAHLMGKEPLLVERIPHAVEKKSAAEDVDTRSSIRSSQYRVRFIDAQADDCAISLVKLPDVAVDEPLVVPTEITKELVVDVPETIAKVTTAEREEREQPEKEELKIEKIVALASEDTEGYGDIEHTLEESKATMKSPRTYRVFSNLFQHTSKLTKAIDHTKAEEAVPQSYVERSSIPSVEQATLGSESDSPPSRLISKIKVRQSPQRQQETITPPPSSEDLPAFPLFSESPGNDETQDDTPETIESSAETEEEVTGVIATLEKMKDRIRPYAESVEKFFEEDDDEEDENDSWAQEAPARAEQLKENFNELVGVLDDICQPIDLEEEEEEHARAADARFAHKARWMSTVLNDVSFSDGSSCDSASTITYDATHLVIDDVVEQVEETNMAQIRMNKTWSNRWSLLRSDSVVAARESKAQSKLTKTRTLSPSRAIPSVLEAPDKPLQSGKRMEGSALRRTFSLKPRELPKIPKSKVVITMTDTNGDRQIDQYSKPMAEFKEARPPLPEFRAQHVQSSSPLCFGTSVVDVVSKALTPTPEKSKENIMKPQGEGQQISCEHREFPPIPKVLVTPRDMQSVGDLTATSHEIQVEMAEFKHLIKQHLAEAKTPKQGQQTNLSFVKDDTELYANVDDSWCRGV